MSELQLEFLGAPLVKRDGQAVSFRTRKTLALLVYLAVEGGLHTREKLAVLLWPESDQGKGRATLRSTLAYLRNALGRGGRLLIERDTLGFNPQPNLEADWLTLQTAWQAARRPMTDSNQATLTALRAQLRTAAALYRSDFLDGFSLDDAPDFDDWASTQRESCHRQMGLVFERLTQLQTEGGALVEATETTMRWLALDPLNEGAHRRLMQLHFAADDRAAALRAYEACQNILARELNARPAPETQALADRIRDFGPQAGDWSDLASAAGLEMPQPDIAPRAAPEFPLVGRGPEHLALVTAYRTMRRGQAQVVTLEGEPGIGKTRLAKEFLGWATAQGADVLHGQAFEASGRLPYQAIIEALRNRLEQENAPDDLLSDLWLAELSRLLPELLERYPDLPRPAAEDMTVQTRLFEAITRLGQALAARTPLILFVDDLQWADAASLDLLQYAARRWTAAGNPVLLLFTVRPGEAALLEPGLGLNKWLLSLQRELPLSRLNLEPLRFEDVRQLVQWLGAAGLDSAAAAQKRDAHRAALPPGALAQFCQHLFSETGGQPFFLVETLKTLFERLQPMAGEPHQADDAWVLAAVDFAEVIQLYLQADDRLQIPPGVQEMISARLARLSPAGQTAGLAAAVLGDNFDFDRLCRVAGLEEEAGLEALEELLDRGLLREQRQPAARPYVLAHDHFREVIYRQAGQARRRIFHRRAFEALTAARAPAAELARHALAAGLVEPAFELHVKAGEEAARLYAPQAAIEHFSQALAVAQQLSAQPAAHLYRARGRAYETVGDFDRARLDFEAALAQAQDDPQNRGQTLQELGFLWASRDYGRAGDYFQQALALTRAGGEPAALARSLNRVGNWYVNIERPFEALAYHQEALALFETTGERAGQAETLDLLGMASYMCSNMDHSRRYYEQAVALFRELDNRRGLVSSLAMLSMVLRATFSVAVLPGSDVARSVPMAETAVAMARDIGWRAGESHALVALGQNLYHQGRYTAALKAVQDGLALAEEIEHPLWTTYARWALGVIYLDLVALPEAQRHLEQALTLARKTGSMFWQHAAIGVLALVFVAQNEHRQAGALVGTVLNSADQHLDAVDWPQLTTMQRVIWYARAELALACGEPSLALQIADQLTAATVNLAEDRAVVRLSKLRGEALAGLGQPAEAEAALRQALSVATTQDEPPLRWRIHQALDRLYQTQKRHKEAGHECAAAQSLLETLANNIEDTTLRENYRRSAQPPG